MSLPNRLVVLFLSLLLLTALTNLQASTAAGSGSSCTMKTLEDQVVAAGQVVSTQDAINLGVASMQYKQASAGFSSVSFSGANDGWSYDSSCKVTWTGLAVNFSMRSANGSKYELVISENPLIGTIYWVHTFPAISAAAISPQCNSPPNFPPCNWSGYAIAADSTQTQQVFESDARWFVPTISEPSGPFQPSCPDGNNPCTLAEWVGLTDENPSMAPGSGTIVQAGILSKIYGSPPTIVSYGWTEIYCTGPSPCQPTTQVCPNPFSPYPVASGDQIQSSEENQLAFNGTPGTNYYIFLNDWTQSWLCTARPNGNPVNVNFTPHYAAFIGERPVPYSTNHLAQFPDWYFTLCAFYLNGGGYQGVYSNYNSGYGYGVYMQNSGSINTNTATMTQVGNGYGQFTLHWLTSQGT